MPVRATGGALCVLALLPACSVRPIETAAAFCRAMERKDMGAAGSLCLPALRAELTNATSALRVVTLHATNVVCVVSDMKSSGDTVDVLLNVEMKLEFPPPGLVKGQVVIGLVRRGSRWYVARGTVRVPRLVQFGTEPTHDGQGVLWNLAGARYGSVHFVDEPIEVFVRRVDRYCRSFEP